MVAACSSGPRAIRPTCSTSRCTPSRSRTRTRRTSRRRPRRTRSPIAAYPPAPTRPAPPPPPVDSPPGLPEPPTSQPPPLRPVSPLSRLRLFFSFLLASSTPWRSFSPDGEAIFVSTVVNRNIFYEKFAFKSNRKNEFQ